MCNDYKCSYASSDDSCDTIHVYCPILVYLSLLCRLVAVLTSAIYIKLGCVTNTSDTQCKSNTSMYMSFNCYPLQKLHKPNDDLVSSFKMVYSRDLQSIAMSVFLLFHRQLPLHVS